MSKPKLPKVWVVLDDGGYPHDRRPSLTRPNLAWPRGWVERLYAPVQKPKVCVWKDDTEDEFWRAPCGKNALYPPGFDMTYCPNCGGKIKVAK